MIVSEPRARPAEAAEPGPRLALEPVAGGPRFSVVVPAYNEAGFVETCLDSLARQDFQGSREIIVVDNNSTDETASLARVNGARVVHEPQPGVCAARQSGTSLASGEIIVSTDADTVFDPGWLSRIDRAFRDNPDLVAVAGPCHFPDAPWWARAFFPAMFRFVGLTERMTGYVAYATAANLAFRRTAWPGYDVWGTQGADEIGLLRGLRSRGAIAFDAGNPVYTSGRRLRRGLAYNLLVTCMFYYVAGYILNGLTGRRVVGMAPAFRGGTCPSAPPAGSARPASSARPSSPTSPAARRARPGRRSAALLAALAVLAVAVLIGRGRNGSQ